MADTLVREAIAYGSQPLSPVPQYWDGTSYAKAQGINGAIRVINYNSAGETFTSASPASVQLTATSTVVISGTSTISVSGTATVGFSATGTVEILSSAGGTAYFSATNPGSVKLTATSTVNFSGSGTVVVSGTATVNFSGSGTVAISGTTTVNFSGSGTVVVSGTSTVTFSGTETVSITGNVTALNQIVGTQANAWSASATISSGATSNAIDLQYNYNISYFGTITNTASATLNLLVSQDNTNYYIATTATITAGTSSDFHYSTTSAARYAKLMISNVSSTITATIAGK